MKKVVPLTVLIAASIALAGCGYTPEQRAAVERPSAAPPARLSARRLAAALAPPSSAALSAPRLARSSAPIRVRPIHPHPRPAIIRRRPRRQGAPVLFMIPMATPSAKDTTAIKSNTALPALLHPSPNHGERKGGRTPDSLIIHYTGVPTGDAAVGLLCDPAMQVSAHYVVLGEGGLVQLVAEERRAWHAGRGSWAGETDMNDVSIGIEIAHPGHKDGAAAYPYPQAQIATVIALCQDIVARWRIAPRRILAHSDIAPDRKIDPGEFFPWAQLAKAGVGHYVAPCPLEDGPRLEHGARGAEVEELQSLLAGYGYKLDVTGLFETNTQTVVRAFQRHFRPALVDGVADLSTIGTLRKLVDSASK